MRFRYSSATERNTSLMPRLPLILGHGEQATTVLGLLDTGASLSVLPYDLGLALGFNWDEQESLSPLSGNLAAYDACSISVQGWHPQILGERSVWLSFAWSKAQHIPVILGQANFFMEFNVCFYRSENWFDIRHKDDHQDQAE